MLDRIRLNMCRLIRSLTQVLRWRAMAGRTIIRVSNNRRFKGSINIPLDLVD